jgi:hypothetical protein
MKNVFKEAKTLGEMLASNVLGTRKNPRNVKIPTFLNPGDVYYSKSSLEKLADHELVRQVMAYTLGSAEVKREKEETLLTNFNLEMNKRGGEIGLSEAAITAHKLRAGACMDAIFGRRVELQDRSSTNGV